MNDLSKPSTLFSGASALGLVTASIYFSRQNTGINLRLNDLSEEIETIKDGLKEKIPQIENTMKSFNHALNNINLNTQNIGMGLRKVEKKYNSVRDDIKEVSDTLDALDQRFVNLVETLITKGNIIKEDVDPPTKVVTKTRNSSGKDKKKSKSSKHRRDETESEESSSESSSESEEDRRDTRRDRRDNRRDNRRDMRGPSNMGMPRRMPTQGNQEDDDIDAVVRMASNRK
jgi:chromosome segregation ATPase